MIIDDIKNRKNYYALGEEIRAALDYFANVDGSNLEKSDVKIDGTDVTVKIRPMTTKDIEDCSFEAHKRHIDIHFVAYGTEKISYKDVKQLKEISYDENKDAAVLEGEGDLLTLKKGYFMITFPQDAHMPCIAEKEPEKLGKMIAKLNA